MDSESAPDYRDYRLQVLYKSTPMEIKVHPILYEMLIFCIFSVLFHQQFFQLISLRKNTSVQGFSIHFIPARSISCVDLGYCFYSIIFFIFSFLFVSSAFADWYIGISSPLSIHPTLMPWPASLEHSFF